MLRWASALRGPSHFLPTVVSTAAGPHSFLLSRGQQWFPGKWRGPMEGEGKAPRMFFSFSMWGVRVWSYVLVVRIQQLEWEITSNLILIQFGGVKGKLVLVLWKLDQASTFWLTSKLVNDPILPDIQDKKKKMTKSAKKVCLHFVHSVTSFLVCVLAKLFLFLSLYIAPPPPYWILTFPSTLRWTGEKKRDEVPFNQFSYLQWSHILCEGFGSKRTM